MATRRITILGSTGSIGTNTLDLVRRAEEGTFEVIALTANKNAELLAEQAIEFGVQYVALANSSNYQELKDRLYGTNIETGVGPKALVTAGKMGADFIMASIIGAAGLEPTLAAIEQGSCVGVANKECLVCAGELVMAKAEECGTTLLPIDSEHNAIFQVLDQRRPETVERLVLTASGGPFLNMPREEMTTIRVQDALNHPIWSMGSKITIDSATMMNKGLELIEASHLFKRPGNDIAIVIHPQSTIHSMVEYMDGSVLAQMGTPDMRTPIAYALAWPERMSAPVERLDLVKLGQMTFFAPDEVKFPSLRLAREALESGGTATNILNAANEIAVAAFLKERIGFTQISELVEETLQRLGGEMSDCMDLGSILALDEQSRRTATELIESLR